MHVIVNSNVSVKRSEERYLVSSPVLKKAVVLNSTDWDFLQKFSALSAVGDIATEMLQDGNSFKNDPTPYDSLLKIYLGVQKYLALGLLIEEIILSQNEVAALNVIPRTISEVFLLESSCKSICSVRVDDLLQVGKFKKLSDDFDQTQFELLLDEYSQSETAQERFLESPLQVCTRPDRTMALLRDVERACVAYTMGLDVRVQLLKPAEFLSRLAASPTEFFGTLRGGVPYQSIFHRGEELVGGRRTDVYERFDKIRKSDLKGKRILDLGCNIGMNCYLATESGALAAMGIDLPELAAAATRLNAFFGMPCRFVAGDLNCEINEIGDHETVFVFALIGHLETTQGIIKTIKNANAKTVYIETHCEIQSQGDLAEFLKSPIFECVEFLGHSLDNLVRQNRTRSFYRGTIKHEHVRSSAQH